MFQKAFSLIDLFKVNANFQVRKPQNKSTFTGRLFTFAIIAVTLYLFVESDMMKKRNPNIIIQSGAFKTRPPLYFNEKNFTLVVGLVDFSNNFHVDDSLFFIEFYIYSQNQTNMATGGETTQLPLVLCTENELANAPSEFKQMNLSKAYCLPKGSYSIKGWWDEPELQYFGVNIGKCFNSSKNNNSCQSQEKIDQFLMYKFVDVFYQNNLYDAASNNNGVVSKMLSYDKLLDPKLSKMLDLSLQKVVVSTDVGFISSQIEHFETLTFGTEANDVWTYDQQSGLNNTYIFQFMIFPYNQYMSIERNYQSLSQCLAQIGGIINVLMMICAAIVNLELRYNKIKYFAEGLYIFDDQKKNNEEERIPQELAEGEVIKKYEFAKFTSSPYLRKITLDNEKVNVILESPIKADTKMGENLESPLSKNIKIEESSQKEKTPNIENSPTSKNPTARLRLSQNWKKKISMFLSSGKTAKNDEIDKFIDLKYRKQHFPLKFSSYLKFILRCTGKPSDEEKLFISGENQILEDLDIIDVLKKLQEIEKLKKILLDENQLYLFEMLTKPIIRTGTNEMKKKGKLEKNMLKDLYNDLRRKENKTGLEIRMLALLDEEVLKSIKKEQK